MPDAYDRRAELAHVPWRQGRLLRTNATRRWSKETWDKAYENERRSAFAFFRDDDQGRSRQYVFAFPSGEECLRAIAAHNIALRQAAEKKVLPG